MDTLVKEKLNLKCSNVDWCGNIPKDWRVEKIKAHFKLSKERASADGNDILSLTQKGIKVRDISGNEGQMAASYDNYAKLRKGDIVLNPMDLISGYVDLASQEGIISPAYTILRNKKTELNLEYAKHYFQWHYIFNIFFPFGKGVSIDHRWTLADDVLLNFPILIPPIKTQEKIADFLDEKSKKIDQIMNEKRKLIELLRERRISVITKAVTKGIDSKVKKKSSGIDWIGDIPEGWTVEKMKALFAYHFGGVWGEEEYENSDDNMICVRIADFDFDNLSVSKKRLTTRNISKNHHHKILAEGSILLEKSGGGDKQPVGRAIVFDLECRAVCSNFIERIEVKTGYNVKFVIYMLSSLYHGKINTKSIKQTTGIQNIDIDSYFKEMVAIPPLKVQECLVDFLDKETSRIDKIIKKTQDQIKKLTEYRSSLIYNAVTGKIKI